MSSAVAHPGGTAVLSDKSAWVNEGETDDGTIVLAGKVSTEIIAGAMDEVGGDSGANMDCMETSYERISKK